jgi:hypothetical protein
MTRLPRREIDGWHLNNGLKFFMAWHGVMVGYHDSGVLSTLSTGVGV